MWRGLTNSDVLETVSSVYNDFPDDEPSAPKPAAGEASDELPVTPSADPELWAAIMASLDQQDKQQRRHLSRHLSDVAPEVADRLRANRQEAVRCSQEGVTFFSWGGAEEGSSEGSPGRGQGGVQESPASHPATDCGLVLPSFKDYPPAVREAVMSQLCNEYLQGEAEGEGIINAVPGCTPQLVLTTLGDGNCLSHSCSLGVWGIHDRDGRLRSAIQATMAHPLAGQHIRARFERQLAASGIPQEDWGVEWEREQAAFGSSGTYLSDVHAYTLANVLRRPLLIYGNEQAAAAALAGIYLPSLWPTPQAHCSRQPLAVLFGWSHFSLLATVQGEGPASPPLLPLCTRDGPLQLRFLSAPEAQQAEGGGTRQLALLRRYMDAEKLVLHGRLGVRLSEAPRPHVLVSLLGSLYLRQAAEQQQGEEQGMVEAAAQA